MSQPDLVRLAESACAAGEFSSVEEAFLALSESPPADLGPALAAAEVLAAAGRRKLAADLLALWVEPLRSSGRHDLVLALLRCTVGMVKESQNLAEPIAEAYRKVYEEWAYLDDFLARSGLLTGREIQTAVLDMERFLRCREGAWFYHRTGWGVGCIAAVDPDASTVRIDFEHNPRHWMPIHVVADDLEYLPPEHFWALRGDDLDKLKRMSEDDPAGLVRLLLDSFGGSLKLKQLKAHLQDVVIPAAAWSRWWTQAKKGLREDPYIEFSEGAAAVLTLREKPKTQGQEAVATMAHAETLPARLAVVREYARRGLSPAEVVQLAGPVVELARRAGTEALLEVALGLDSLDGAVFEDLDPKEILASSPDRVASLVAVETPDLQIKGLRVLRGLSGEEWPAAYAQAIPRLSREARETAAQSLLDAEHLSRVREAMQTILVERNPDAWIWFLRLTVEPDTRTLAPASPIKVLNKFLDVLDGLARDGGPEDIKGADRMRTALGAKRFKLLMDALEYGDVEDARYIVQRLPFVKRLSNTQLNMSTARIAQRWPDAISKFASDQARTLPGDEVVLTTREGLERKQAEFRRLVEEDIPANTDEIGRTRAFGDLRENAEYHAAIERGKLLQERAGVLENDLARARILDAEAITTERVTVGCRVRVQNLETQQEQTFDILGPWDADPDQGVISYRSPMAQSLLDCGPGDEALVEVAGNRHSFRILAIENCLTVPR